MSETTFPYPAMPPKCQTPGPNFAQECQGCPMLPDCGYRNLAIGNAALGLERDKAIEDSSRLARYVDFLSWDHLMDGYLTAGGFELSVREENNIRDALKDDIDQGRAGLITLDVRGMNMVNLYGHDDVGDVFLQIIGYQIRHSVRTPDSADYGGMNRRKEGSPVADQLFVRKGGDEISILMRGIQREHFDRRLKELRDSLSVERAMAEGDTGVPLIASVGGAHATEIILPTTWGEPDSVLSAVKNMQRCADDRAITLRLAQYDVLLDYVYQKEPELRKQYPDPLKRPEPPVIARKFFEHYFPHFATNVKDVIHTVQAEIERQLH